MSWCPERGGKVSRSDIGWSRRHWPPQLQMGAGKAHFLFVILKRLISGWGGCWVFYFFWNGVCRLTVGAFVPVVVMVVRVRVCGQPLGTRRERPWDREETAFWKRQVSFSLCRLQADRVNLEISYFLFNSLLRKSFKTPFSIVLPASALKPTEGLGISSCRILQSWWECRL